MAEVRKNMCRTIAQLFALALVLVTCFVHAQEARKPEQSARPTVQERLGYPATARLLIIHADDLGMSHSVNRAIFEALKKHWITSSSILVPCPWFPEVVRFSQAHPDADLGIHLALNSEWTTYRWFPLSPREKVPSLLDHDGYMPLEETTVAQQARIPEVALELQAQIDRALASGIHISHLDTHMTALVGSLDLFRAYQQMGRKYRLPILVGSYRIPAGAVLSEPETLVQSVLEISPGVPPDQWLNYYERTLAPLGPGVYELIVHLGYDDEEMRGATADHPDWGASWRQHDLDMVKNPAFQKFLHDQGFILVTWRELTRALPSI